MHLFKEDQNKNPLDYYGLRQGAVKQELMPSYKNITKPTRDIQASNRSHSLSKQDLNGSYNNRILTSQKKIMMLQKQLEQCQFQRQANIVYNRQFRQIGRILGNQNMQFDQIKQKIEDLILEAPQIEYHQLQNQQNYQSKIFKEQIEALQRQLLIKTKTLSELNEKKSSQKNVCLSLCRSFKDHPQYTEYVDRIQSLQGQIRSLKIQSKNMNTSQIHKLESQVLKLKKQEESYIFTISNLQTKLQTFNAQIQVFKAKQLTLKNYQNQSKLLYKGVHISASTLLKQLLHRDEQLLNQNYFLMQVQQKLQRQQKKSVERDISQSTIGKNLRQAQSKIFQFQQNKRITENQLKSLRSELQSNKISLRQYQQRLNQYRKINDILNSKKIELEERQSKNFDNELEISELRKKVKEQEEEIIKLGSYIQRINLQNQQLKHSKQMFEMQKIKIQKQYKQLSDIYIALSDSFQKINLENSNSKKQLNQLKLKHQQSILFITALQKNYDSIKQTYEQLMQKYSNSNNQYNLNMKKISSNQNKNQSIIRQHISTIQQLQSKLKLQIKKNQSLQCQICRLKVCLQQVQKIRYSNSNTLDKTKQQNNYIITQKEDLQKNIQVSFQNNIDRQSNGNSRLNPIKSMEKIQNNISNIQSHGKSINNSKQYYQYEYFNKYSSNNIEANSNVRISESHYNKQNGLNNKSHQTIQRQIQLIQRGSQIQFKHNADNNKYQIMIISLQDRIKYLESILQKNTEKSFVNIQDQNQNLRRKLHTMQQQIQELNKVINKNQASSVNKYSGNFGKTSKSGTNGHQQIQTIKISNVQINLNSSFQSKNQQSKNRHYSYIRKFLQEFQVQMTSINVNFNQLYQIFKNKILSYAQTIDNNINIEKTQGNKKYLEDYEGQQISKLTKKSCFQEQKIYSDNLSGSELKFQKRQEFVKSNQISRPNINQIDKIKMKEKNKQNDSDDKSDSHNQSHGQLSRKILNQNFQKQSQDQLSDKIQAKKQSQKVEQSQNRTKQQKHQANQLQRKKQIEDQQITIKNKQIVQTIRQENKKSIHQKIKEIMDAQIMEIKDTQIKKIKEHQSLYTKNQSNILPQYSNKNKKQISNVKVFTNNPLIIQSPMKNTQNIIRPLSTIISNSSMISHNSGLMNHQIVYKQNSKQFSLSHQKRQNSSKSTSNRPPSRISINYGNTSKIIYTSKSPLSYDISPIKSDNKSIIQRSNFISPIGVGKKIENRTLIKGEQKKQFIQENSFSKQLSQQNIIRQRQNYQIGYQQSLPIYSSKQLIGRKSSNSNKNIIFNQLKSSRISQSKRSFINIPQNYSQYPKTSVIEKLKKQTIVNDEYYPVNSQWNQQIQSPKNALFYNSNQNIYNNISSTGRFIQNSEAFNYANYKTIKTDINQTSINGSSNKETIFMHKNLLSSNIKAENIENKTMHELSKHVSNESFELSQDSGIDVLQYDKGFNCCKH